MPVIATLTLNPAIDVSTSAERVEPTRKLRCRAGRRDPGGGGINVARVASRLGAEAIAVYPCAGLAGQLLHRLVELEGLRSIAVPVSGETREDFTVLDAASGEQYRFVLPGPHMHGAEWMACLKALAGLDVRPDIVCASGSLPPGAPDDFYARVAEIVASWGVRFALDTSGAPLKAALRERLCLIKPNLRELREIAGGALDDEASLTAACRALIAQGRTEAVALTLGHEGALLVTADRAWRAAPMPLQAVSAVGAGDSFLGGMAWAIAAKKPLEEAFRYGVAAGSAAVLAEGTELSRPEDVRRLLPQVVIEPAPGPRKVRTAA
jgi:6-phosphofructokinase 2